MKTLPFTVNPPIHVLLMGGLHTIWLVMTVVVLMEIIKRLLMTRKNVNGTVVVVSIGTDTLPQADVLFMTVSYS